MTASVHYIIMLHSLRGTGGGSDYTIVLCCLSAVLQSSGQVSTTQVSRVEHRGIESQANQSNDLDNIYVSPPILVIIITIIEH